MHQINISQFWLTQKIPIICDFMNITMLYPFLIHIFYDKCAVFHMFYIWYLIKMSKFSCFLHTCCVSMSVKCPILKKPAICPVASKFTLYNSHWKKCIVLHVFCSYWVFLLLLNLWNGKMLLQISTSKWDYKGRSRIYVYYNGLIWFWS